MLEYPQWNLKKSFAIFQSYMFLMLSPDQHIQVGPNFR